MTTVLNKKHMAILFADTHGYSRLTPTQLNKFLVEVLPKVAAILTKYKASEPNSWGDGVVAFFDNTDEAARCALEIRDLFIKENWSKLELPNELTVRVALHFGPIFVGFDPIRQRDGFVGTQINLAARIEPVVAEGSVYATNTFVQVLRREPDSKIDCDAFGVIELAKGWGAEELFHVRWATDPPADYKVSPPPPGGPSPKVKSPLERLVTREQLRDPAIGLSWNSVEQRCKENLLITGWSCRGVHLGSTRDTFLHLAKTGRKVQFLIYDPAVFEDCPINLAPVCNVGPEYVHHDVRKGLEDVAQLVEMAEADAKGNIELRLTNWLIAWSAVAIDRSSSDGILQVELYHYLNPYKVLNHLDKRVELILTPESMLYEGFRGSLDAIWESAKSQNPISLKRS